MMKRLEPKSIVKRVNALSLADTHEMHQVFLKYYHNADLNTFIKDILKKQYVLLIKHPENGNIVGFSTICLLNLEYKGQKAVGLFSGDTILEKEFWGSYRWKVTWALFCLKIIILNFRVPIFWLLISKGYKTYMLLANNFINYYPRFDKEDEDLAEIVDSYCEELFSNYYVKERRILDFGNQYQKLQSHVAEIDDDLKETQPKIRFFEERNPEWRRGTELPCIGIINTPVILRFLKKMVIDKKLRISRKVAAYTNKQAL